MYGSEITWWLDAVHLPRFLFGVRGPFYFIGETNGVRSIQRIVRPLGEQTSQLRISICSDFLLALNSWNAYSNQHTGAKSPKWFWILSSLFFVLLSAPPLFLSFLFPSWFFSLSFFSFFLPQFLSFFQFSYVFLSSILLFLVGWLVGRLVGW